MTAAELTVERLVQAVTDAMASFHDKCEYDEDGGCVHDAGEWEAHMASRILPLLAADRARALETAGVVRLADERDEARRAFDVTAWDLEAERGEHTRTKARLQIIERETLERAAKVAATEALALEAAGAYTREVNVARRIAGMLCALLPTEPARSDGQGGNDE